MGWCFYLYSIFVSHPVDSDRSHPLNCVGTPLKTLPRKFFRRLLHTTVFAALSTQTLLSIANFYVDSKCEECVDCRFCCFLCIVFLLQLKIHFSAQFSSVITPQPSNTSPTLGEQIVRRAQVRGDQMKLISHKKVFKWTQLGRSELEMAAAWNRFRTQTPLLYEEI